MINYRSIILGKTKECCFEENERHVNGLERKGEIGAKGKIKMAILEL